MAKDAKGHGSEAHGNANTHAFAADARVKLSHAVTAYDRKQEERAASPNRGGYYNSYALPQYLGAVERIHTELARGTPAADAINNHMNGALARAAHKALGTGGTDVDTMRRKSFK